MRAATAMSSRAVWFRRNRTRITVLAVLGFLFLVALGGLDREDWLITILRGLAVGAITFLVASGLSLIFGLMDVLNLAHGEIFILGASLGRTMYTRPDTVVDVFVPMLMLGAPLVLMPWLRRAGARIRDGGKRKAIAGGLLVVGAAGVVAAVARFPLAIWNPGVYTQSPITYSLAIDMGTLAPLPRGSFAGSAVVVIVGLLVAVVVFAVGLQALAGRSGGVVRVSFRRLAGSLLVLGAAVALLVLRDPVVEWLFSLGTTTRFLLAIEIGRAHV